MSSTPDPADPADAVTAVDGESSAPSEESTATDAAAAVTDEAPVDEPEPEATVEPESAPASAVEESEPEADPEPEAEPDPQLLAAHDLALAALREITPEATVGAPADYRVEAGGVVSLRFANRLPGYPGWFWTVSLARVEDAEPTVLEVELLPGDGALLAPDWVPWAVRLADYHAAQAALAEAAHDEDDEDLDEDEDLDDVEDLDASDFDDDGSPILHAGDVDGVDIDELAEAGADDDEDFDDDDSDEEDSDDSDDDDSDDDASDDDDFDDEDDDSDDEDDDSEDDDDDSEDDDDSDDDADRG